MNVKSLVERVGSFGLFSPKRPQEISSKQSKDSKMEESKEEATTAVSISHEQLAALVEDEYDFTRLRRGEICKATILSVEENQVIVDLGVKRDGIVPENDLQRLDKTVRDGLHVEQRVPVYVLSAQDDREQILVSLNRGFAQQDWLRAKALEESGEVFSAEVVRPNRGGVLVQFGRLQGFVPNSHLISIPRGMRGEKQNEAKEKLVGKTLTVVVLEVVQKRRRLVLSERDARQKHRQQRLREFNEGQVCTGIVRNVVNFGAFVDLGGIDGLIHISELSWKHVKHPSEVLNVGDEVKVYVILVDRERERVGLSRKRLLPDPWESVLEIVEEGRVVEGSVTQRVKFGVFVELTPGVEGLVHNSEIPDHLNPELDLSSGATVWVRVLHIDEYRRRISLTLKDVERVPAQRAALLSDR
jgi:small subunit ribosomal protein S1